jgi:RNA polymerase sigma factor (sigma-70 family)
MERRCTIGRMNETATARSGETGALDTWYRAHAQKLFCTVRRITRNHEDAEDAVQDAFLRAFLHLQSFDGRSTFSTWLTRIGINSALMILRKRRNSREVPAQNSDESDALWEITDSVPDPEKQYVEKERAGLVRKAITNLRLKNPASSGAAQATGLFTGRNGSRDRRFGPGGKGPPVSRTERAAQIESSAKDRESPSAPAVFRICSINCSQKREETG